MGYFSGNGEKIEGRVDYVLCLLVAGQHINILIFHYIYFWIESAKIAIIKIIPKIRGGANEST